MIRCLRAFSRRSTNPELRFTLRTFRQPLRLLHERNEAGRDAVGEFDLDDATRANLERLGYLAPGLQFFSNQ
ncbi:hypothetical protein C487_18316 [Natrinema pallidum DSM 3751]|uniref:Uncharacterized protein n=1 Tax=Natrinema pallidum DSM 3751 TaxID=1227495 RepID=L9YEX1_9EURY|nr:hypothetical protein C487_18316 [Natrinema pallidum DSM 3751]